MAREINPFNVSIQDGAVQDLQSRLARTRFPTSEPVSDWSQGVPLETMKYLVNYWLHEYDMKRLQKTLNTFPQFTTTIADLTIHFLHVKSSDPNAIPMLILHGWPGSILEFRHVISELSAPTSAVSQAFHLVIPSLPGYGFSSVPTKQGYGFRKSAGVYSELMNRLGYSDKGYIAQGGDWGAEVVAEIARLALPGLKAVHMNSAYFDARHEYTISKQKGDVITDSEEKAVRLAEAWTREEDGYTKQQTSRPQTLGYSLADSPTGLLGWMYEKMVVWADNSRAIVNKKNPGLKATALSTDEILDTVMLYWLTNTETSSARMYWESGNDTTAVEIPESIAVGVSLFPADHMWASETWARRYYKNLVHWKELDRGGHFAAWEQPEIFVKEVREFVSKVKML